MVHGLIASNSFSHISRNSGLRSASDSDVRQCAGAPAIIYAPPGVELRKKDIMARMVEGLWLRLSKPKPVDAR